jgi:RNA polymerase sigma-70 factor (ECF subfamily)
MPASSRRPDLRGLGDEDLMVMVADGDARAFEVIFDRHSGPAFSLAYRICGRRTLAEDVVQEAFMSLWRSGGRYERGRGSVRTWVLGIVHNRSIDAIRRGVTRDSKNVSDEGLAERLPAAEDTHTQAARRDEAELVRGVLEQLPAEQRQVIELAFFGGFTHTQIAEMLELPAGTVKGRMRLGLTRMRGALGDRSAYVL